MATTHHSRPSIHSKRPLSIHARPSRPGLLSKRANSHGAVKGIPKTSPHHEDDSDDEGVMATSFLQYWYVIGCLYLSEPINSNVHLALLARSKSSLLIIPSCIALRGMHLHCSLCAFHTHMNIAARRRTTQSLFHISTTNHHH
jgi:hypothetical protein